MSPAPTFPVRPALGRGVRRGWHLAAVLAALALAGCLTPADPGPQEPEPAQRLDGADPATLPPEPGHDHADPAQHGTAIGLARVGFTPIEDLLPDDEGRLSDLQFHGDLTVTVANGREGASAGGFVTLDASDPADLAPLGRYRSGSEDNWYTKITPTGRHVLLTANGGTSPDDALAGARESIADGAATGPARGIHVVDVTDPADPRLASVHPVPVRVINLATWLGPDNATYVAASILQDTGAASPPAGAWPAEPDHVRLLRLNRSTGQLVELARWRPPGEAGPSVFGHDLHVAEHPATGDTLLYAAFWDAGGYVVNVDDPADPRTLGRVPPAGPADHVHTFKPHPGRVDGRAIAVLAPETFAAEPPGTYRAVDVTDPSQPEVVASFSLPGDGLRNAEPLLFSPHEFSLANGRVYTSNDHAGAWVLDLPDLEPLAAWQNATGPARDPEAWAVNAETTVHRDGLVYVVDMQQGIHALQPRLDPSPEGTGAGG